jgi:hypothetical protein
VSWRDRLGHPVAVALLAGSLLVAGSLASLPTLATWSERALAFVLLGLSGYAAAVLVVSRWPPVPPELLRVNIARRNIGRLLKEREKTTLQETRPEWLGSGAEVLLKIDEEITPALVLLLNRRADLARYLAAHEQGQRPALDIEVLQRLHDMRTRQDEAASTCVRRIVNAEATLVALVQNRDDASLAHQLRALVDQLGTLHASLADSLESRPLQPTAVTDVPLIPPQEPEIAAGEPADQRPRQPEQPNLEELVKVALQDLNKPDALARCELATHLPQTIRAIRKRWGEAPDAEATPLEQSHALREAVLAGIERLNVSSGENSPPPLQYDILREEYVLGMSTKHIMVRHAISEATLHRRRQEGVRALAAELATRERLLTRRSDPVALDYLG